MGLLNFCFLCSKWFSDETSWTTHCLSHLHRPAELPTQYNPFIYGQCLAAPGFCPWCLHEPTLHPTQRMRLFLDRAEWQDHVQRHINGLDSFKAAGMPRPSPEVPRCVQIFARDAVSPAGYSLLDSEKGWQAAPVSRRCAPCSMQTQEAVHGQNFHGSTYRARTCICSSEPRDVWHRSFGAQVTYCHETFVQPKRLRLVRHRRQF